MNEEDFRKIVATLGLTAERELPRGTHFLIPAQGARLVSRTERRDRERPPAGNLLQL
jgi:hypothetical protein